VCVLVSTDRGVNLKRLAAATGAKGAALLAPAHAERATGYHVGGISPFGQKKPARRGGRRLCHRLRNGGRRGFEIDVRPADLVRVLDATVVELT